MEGWVLNCPVCSPDLPPCRMRRKVFSKHTPKTPYGLGNANLKCKMDPSRLGIKVNWITEHFLSFVDIVQFSFWFELVFFVISGRLLFFGNIPTGGLLFTLSSHIIKATDRWRQYLLSCYVSLWVPSKPLPPTCPDSCGLPPVRATQAPRRWPGHQNLIHSSIHKTYHKNPETKRSHHKTQKIRSQFSDARHHRTPSEVPVRAVLEANL